MKNKKIILVDMDGVCANLHKKWLEEINYRYNRNINLIDWTIHEPHTLFNLSEDIYKILDEPDMFFNLDPIEDSQECMELLWQQYNCYIVSAVSYSNNATKDKWRWLQKHFPFIDKTKVIFAKDKSMVRGNLLIDDAVFNIKAFPKSTILFHQPWNSLWKETKGCTRLYNWKEIINYINGDCFAKS